MVDSDLDFEDLAEDVTPLANIGRAEAKAAAALRRSRESRPAGPRSALEVAGAFFGLPLRRYAIDEILEQELKARKADQTTIFGNLMDLGPRLESVRKLGRSNLTHGC